MKEHVARIHDRKKGDKIEKDPLKVENVYDPNLDTKEFVLQVEHDTVHEEKMPVFKCHQCFHVWN